MVSVFLFNCCCLQISAPFNLPIIEKSLPSSFLIRSYITRNPYPEPFAKRAKHRIQVQWPASANDMRQKRPFLSAQCSGGGDFQSVVSDHSALGYFSILLRYVRVHRGNNGRQKCLLAGEDHASNDADDPSCQRRVPQRLPRGCRTLRTLGCGAALSQVHRYLRC